jgi:aspartyl-tRNA(Asn)/glutamyl-tRNA(Gln) amidotransferase subunit C
MLNSDDVKKIAFLARLGLTEEEIDKFAPQLSSVLEYMDILNEVDTDGVEPTSQVTGLTTVSQEDLVLNEYDPEELLKVTEMPLERHQIRVKSVFKDE